MEDSVHLGEEKEIFVVVFCFLKGRKRNSSKEELTHSDVSILWVVLRIKLENV